MAYVLGVFYSDGCISPSSEREERKSHKNRSPVCTISVSQKEPELLEKLLALMESNARLNFQHKRGIAGAIYTFQIRSDKMYDDLLSLGLTPRKSRTITFPSLPHECVRHFLRGCWDGDGSIYLESNDPLRPRAHYVSGSRAFIDGLAHQLCEEGFTKATVHTAKSGRSFYVKYGPKDCVKLFHLFYDGVNEAMFLNRKHDRFKSASDVLTQQEPARDPFTQ
jgi:LAGLIDADG-like domain